LNIGTANELKAMSYYQSKGCQIYTPIGHDSTVDFIAVEGGNTHLIQVKTCGKRRYKDVIYTMAPLRKSDGSSYSLKEIDVFFVVDGDEAYEIPAHVLEPETKCLMLTATKKGYVPRHGFNVDDWKVKL